VSDSIAAKQREIGKIIADRSLPYHQKQYLLALAAENLLPYPQLSPAARDFMERGIIHDLDEGHAPYRPRYILPDYAKFMANGCTYLELGPPGNIMEAVQSLLLFYAYVPSITGYPVYLGDGDSLLEPFVAAVPTKEAEAWIKWYLIGVDRLCPSAFTHLNIGPQETATGRLLLQTDMRLKQAVPNISLKYDPTVTGDGLALLAAASALTTGKPHFCNHRLFTSDLGEYGIASCYNSLPLGGGSHTLVRINVRQLVLEHEVPLEMLLDEIIPQTAALAVEIANARARFLVEEAGFFDTSFLAREGFISIDRFTTMVGPFGVAEAVNLLMERQGLTGKYGTDATANQLGYLLVERLYTELMGHEGLYCQGTGGRMAFHAQSGISADIDETPGTRIPIGSEPTELFDHIQAVAPQHRRFNAGISDILVLELTARDNLPGVLNIIKGAMAADMRTITLHASNSELVRITGYLVRKTEVEACNNRQELRSTSSVFGAEAIAKQRTLERRIYR